jgi:single-stranded-DNA-specific exonuclease
MEVTARTVGERHLKLFAKGADGARIEAIAFGTLESPLSALAQGGRFHLAGRLERNDWGGRLRIDLKLDDAARA